ncbi:MAG: hypothetical protein NT080_03395 [Spirochaetes bacterium]|nr:hypothetical protein [Spirochaetota bacterium]
MRASDTADFFFSYLHGEIGFILNGRIGGDRAAAARAALARAVLMRDILAKRP